MSQFEFIFVLISIIAGLALAQLLSGLARPPRNSNGQLDIAHVVFSLSTTLLLIVVWWATFRWQAYENWTFAEFFLLCAYISLFYVLAVILNPMRSAELPEFKVVRTKFYAVFASYGALEILVIYVRDGEFSPWYLPMITHVSALSLLGIYLRRDLFDKSFAIWLVIVNAGGRSLLDLPVDLHDYRTAGSVVVQVNR